MMRDLLIEMSTATVEVYENPHVPGEVRFYAYSPTDEVPTSLTKDQVEELRNWLTEWLEKP